jgi:hypothetical protein
LPPKNLPLSIIVDNDSTTSANTKLEIQGFLFSEMTASLLTKVLPLVIESWGPIKAEVLLPPKLPPKNLPLSIIVDNDSTTSANTKLEIQGFLFSEMTASLLTKVLPLVIESWGPIKAESVILGCGAGIQTMHLPLL